MSITIREILQIEPFNTCKLLSGERGLSNVVKYTTTMEMPDISPWLSSNLLLITTGYAIKDNPEALIPLMNNLHEAKCAGLLIKQEYIGAVPLEAINLSEIYNIPIIILPNHIPFVSLFVPLMNAISEKQDIQLQNSRLLMTIINGDFQEKNEISLRADTLEWPQPPLRVLILEIFEFKQGGLSSIRTDKKFVKEELLHCIESHFIFELKQSVIITMGDFFTVITPDTGSLNHITSCLRDTFQDIEALYGIQMKCGVSDPVYEYSKVKEAYTDAKEALAIGKKLDDPDDIYTIRKFRLEQDFSHYRMNPRMRDYYNETIGVLFNYDKENNTELVKTLNMLVQCMGNKTKAANALFLHRNTLQYRIKKIEELTGLSLNDGENLIRIAIITKISRLL